VGVSIQLDDDEALVLFEFLASREDLRAELKLEAPEFHAFDSLHAALERVLVVPFEPNYSTLLSAARTSLIERFGKEWT